jgi:DNA helicase-2/ATP-dependent DNA helicase PcrA
MTPSRFLGEVPPQLIDDRTVGGSELFGLAPSPSERFLGRLDYDLYSEREQVRNMAESRLAGAKNRFSVKTYDSADAVAQFFQQRGLGSRGQRASKPPAASSANQSYPERKSKPTLEARPPAGARPGQLRRGSRVRHSKYGVGSIVLREGDGEDAKVTVMFEKHGLKKMVVKYAGLQTI